MSPLHYFLLVMPGFFSKLIGGIFGLGGSLFDYFGQKRAIDQQIALQREINQSNVEQADLAYRRSLPTAQVSNLQDAGMSKAGALSALSGGGNYVAPTLGAPSVQAPHFDTSPVVNLMREIGEIPANVEQRNLVKTQIQDLETRIENERSAEKRAKDLHEYDVWRKMYDKQTVQKLDAGTNLLLNSLLDSGKDINDFKSYEDLVRGLGLQDAKELRDLPSLARQRLFSDVRDRFDLARQEREQKNRNIAAQDAHNMSVLEQALKRIDVKYYDKEKHEQLLNLMRVGVGLIQDNNIKFQDYSAKEMENFVRSAGIEDEAQAKALAEYVKRLANEDEMDILFKRKTANEQTFGLWNNGRMLLRDLGEILARVNLGK